MLLLLYFIEFQEEHFPQIPTFLKSELVAYSMGHFPATLNSLKIQMILTIKRASLSVHDPASWTLTDHPAATLSPQLYLLAPPEPPRKQLKWKPHFLSTLSLPFITDVPPSPTTLHPRYQGQSLIVLLGMIT